MKTQVYGSPYDRLGDGKSWCMNLAVDGATTGMRAGWFMERGCMRCCACNDLGVMRHGAPRSMYYDKGSISRAAKDGSPTQLEFMMRDMACA